MEGQGLGGFDIEVEQPAELPALGEGVGAQLGTEVGGVDYGLQEGPDGLQPFAVKLVGVHVLEDGIALERMGEGLEEGMKNRHGGLRGEGLNEIGVDGLKMQA